MWMYRMLGWPLASFSSCSLSSQPPRIHVPKEGATNCPGWPLHNCQPLNTSPAMRVNTVNFPGHLMNHGMQSKPQHYFHIGTFFPLTFIHSVFFFSLSGFASKHPARVKSSLFHILFFHFHNHSPQFFRFCSCLSHFPHTLPSAHWLKHNDQWHFPHTYFQFPSLSLQSGTASAFHGDVIALFPAWTGHLSLSHTCLGSLPNTEPGH